MIKKNVHVNFASKKGAVTPLGKSKDWTQEEEDEEELKMKMNLNPKMVKGKKIGFIDLAMNLVKGNGQRQYISSLKSDKKDHNDVRMREYLCFDWKNLCFEWKASHFGC